MNLTARVFRKFCQQMILVFLLLFQLMSEAPAQKIKTSIINVDSGWAGNSVNTVVFRKNSIVSFKNVQFIAFYNNEGNVVIGKRKITSKKWDLKITNFKGNIKDAHNDISIMLDGDGFLHMAWDHHNSRLSYVKSVKPLSLELSDKQLMTGKAEQSVSYPEFYKLADGNLLFLYRDGGSGRGNLVINRYNLQSKQWVQLHNNLIDGEGKRNAYWQAFVDSKGTIHISWVWRESPDVASNHDMCYAQSKDGGMSWQNSRGEKFNLPITAASAEYAFKIPQSSELINQTSMHADETGNPFIATYWKDKDTGIPQYKIIYLQNNQWSVQSLSFRKTGFSLSGAGTKKIPISRPQIICWNEKNVLNTAVIFRDNERQNRVSIAINKNFLSGNNWVVADLTNERVGDWEPTYDTELWRTRKQLHLYIQHVKQADAEGIVNTRAEMVKVLQWTASRFY